MKQFALMMLAASALAPASAVAQQRTAAPPVKWEDTPTAQMRMPRGHAQMAQPPAAHAPMMRPPHAGQSHAAPHHVRSKPPVVVQHHGPAQVHVRNGDRMRVRHHPGNQMGMRGHHGFKNYSNYRRIDRGFFLPQPWWGQGYHIQNYSMYGLPQPIGGGRWVRYYDDALMIDAGGRVHDGRYGMAWDEWQDQWAYDDRGVPVYSGNGDFYPGEEDYAWVEGEDGAYVEGHEQVYDNGQGYAYGGCPQTCAYPPVAPAYPHGYGYGYGQGWGYGAGMVVTETTVTTAPTVITETWVEEEVVYEQRARKARKYRAKPRYHRPRPQPGERG